MARKTKNNKHSTSKAILSAPPHSVELVDASDEMSRVTITLSRRNVEFLDRLADDINVWKNKGVTRSSLIRAIVDAVDQACSKQDVDFTYVTSEVGLSMDLSMLLRLKPDPPPPPSLSYSTLFGERRRRKQKTRSRLSSAEMATLGALDGLLGRERRLEYNNEPANRLSFNLVSYDTCLGRLPAIIFFNTDVVTIRPKVSREQNDFERYACEAPPSRKQRELFAEFQALDPDIQLPVVCTRRAIVSCAPWGESYRLVVGTVGRPGWRTFGMVPEDMHSYLREMIEDVGGMFIMFAEQEVLAPAYFVSNYEFVDEVTDES